MDFSTIASIFVFLARPLSWGAAFGSSFGCLVGVAAARMQTVLRNARAAPSETKDASLAAPRRLVVNQLFQDTMPDPSDAEVNLGILEEMKLELQEGEFINLLQNLVGESRCLRNDPAAGLIPEERRAATLVRDELDCFDQGIGPLKINEFESEPGSGRTNLIVIYDQTGDPNAPSMAFAGMHFDIGPGTLHVKKSLQDDGCGLEGLGNLLGFDQCVDSKRSSFRLDNPDEPEKIYGPGTSAGLGHVALLTLFLKSLARSKPKLRHSIHVFFFAGREGGEVNIGADYVLQDKEICKLKPGSPVFWLDAGDCNLCCQSTGSLGWSLKASIDQSSNDFLHEPINSIELVYAAFSEVQKSFKDMRPTQIACSAASFETVMFGDICIQPSFEIDQIMKGVESVVTNFTGNLSQRCGKVELSWIGGLDLARILQGIDVNRRSNAHRALARALRKASSASANFSVRGSIPHARMWQDHGFDIQICGFGRLDGMYSRDEHCLLQDMARGYKVLCSVVCLLEQSVCASSLTMEGHSHQDRMSEGGSSEIGHDYRCGLSVTRASQPPRNTDRVEAAERFQTGDDDVGCQVTIGDTHVEMHPTIVGSTRISDASRFHVESLGSEHHFSIKSQTDERVIDVDVNTPSAGSQVRGPKFSQCASVASWIQPRPWPMIKAAYFDGEGRLLQPSKCADMVQKGISVEDHVSDDITAPENTSTHTPILFHENLVERPTNPSAPRDRVVDLSSQDVPAILDLLSFSWLWGDTSVSQLSSLRTSTPSYESHEY